VGVAVKKRAEDAGASARLAAKTVQASMTEVVSSATAVTREV
jgi:hypothetical protein